MPDKFAIARAANSAQAKLMGRIEAKDNAIRRMLELLEDGIIPVLQDAEGEPAPGGPPGGPGSSAADQAADVGAAGLDA